METGGLRMKRVVKWSVGDEEWRVESGGWSVESDRVQCRVESGKCSVELRVQWRVEREWIEWRVENGERRVEIEWRVETGEWRVWRVKIFVMCSAYRVLRDAWFLSEVGVRCLHSGSWVLSCFFRPSFHMAWHARRAAYRKARL